MYDCVPFVRLLPTSSEQCADYSITQIDISVSTRAFRTHCCLLSVQIGPTLYWNYHLIERLGNYWELRGIGYNGRFLLAHLFMPDPTKVYCVEEPPLSLLLCYTDPLVVV